MPAYSSQGTVHGRAAYSNVQPVWQYVLLQFCTFGFYSVVWFYNNWRLIKERNHWDITPAARAIFAMLWIRSQFKELLQIVRASGCEANWSPEGIAAAFIICGMLGRAAGRAPEPLSTVLFVVLLGVEIGVTVPVVKGLNSFWRHEQPDLPERRGFSPGGWVAVILGGLFWLLVVAGMLMPEG